MRNYKQLSQGQRYQIEILLKAGHTQKEIAHSSMYRQPLSAGK